MPCTYPLGNLDDNLTGPLLAHGDGLEVRVPKAASTDTMCQIKVGGMEARQRLPQLLALQILQHTLLLLRSGPRLLSSKLRLSGGEGSGHILALPVSLPPDGGRKDGKKYRRMTGILPDALDQLLQARKGS